VGVQARPKDETEEDAEMEEDEEIEEVDSDEWEDDGEPIANEDCLFCSHHSTNIQANLSHMMTSHSFFIPDVEYLIDVVDILNYLGRKVGLRSRCLWCDERGKRFRSLDAVQKHMVSLGHCKIRHEGDGLAEYSEFYDYTSSYPDAEAADGDEEAPIAELDDSAYELTLPSGTVIGHRSLLRYYK
jgi:pre-60S factor REI1